MELSEVRCSSASEELYTINSGNGGNGSARPKRLLWQTAVRHITEQRFIHEQGGGGGAARSSGSDQQYEPGSGARKQSAGRTSVGDRHNNGGTKVFPERASSDLGFLQLDCAPSNSDFFLNWGYTYRGVIFPTLRNSFKSRDLEQLYQRYFLGQRRKSVVVMNILDVVTKLTLLVLHLTLASSPMDPIKGTLLGFFTGIEVVICALVVVRKDTTSHSYLQYSGVVTWVAMATQILAAGLGYGLLGDGVGYVLFTLFATYNMLPLPLTWAILAGLLTSGLHVLVQLLISESAQLSTNQVSSIFSSSSAPLAPTHLLPRHPVIHMCCFQPQKLFMAAKCCRKQRRLCLCALVLRVQTRRSLFAQPSAPGAVHRPRARAAKRCSSEHVELHLPVNVIFSFSFDPLKAFYFTSVPFLNFIHFFSSTLSFLFSFSVF